jgi:Dullard-like phosphatase family protein
MVDKAENNKILSQLHITGNNKQKHSKFVLEDGNSTVKNDSIKKSVTTALYASEKPTLFKKELGKLKTFTQITMSEISILKLMSENVYSIPSVKKKDDSDSELSDDEEEEITVKHRRIKVKTKTLKKMSVMSKMKGPPIGSQNFLDVDKNNTNKKQSSKTHVSSFSNEKDKEDKGKIFDFDEEKETVNIAHMVEVVELQDDENNHNNEIVLLENKTPITEDDILNNLLSQYYMDISDNYIGNFEDYVVNNLTIISYIEKILPKKLTAPKLSEENKKIISKFDRTKKILFLDLDETLIHSDLNNQFKEWDAQVTVAVDENTNAQLNLLIRPHLSEFLEFCSKNFNVILFTAGIESYADSILGHIDPLEEYFHMRLYRDSCYNFKNFFIKDLSILETFGLKDMIILDNCVFSFAKNLKNGILIPSYYHDPEDKELLNVMEYLESKLIDVKDIRDVNEAYYGLETIRNFLYEKLISEGVIEN